MMLNCRNSEECAVAMAMIIMAANAAGIYGAQIFRADDAPRYHRGFAVNCGLLGGALAFAIFQFAREHLARKKGETELGDDSSELEEKD
ncbi:hypothetical protein FRB98_007039 [Tulasnella sp. 332]|nr:hypothetical protein FRB98_007039 [Tulasnella sp. 332]